jgi:hypothetical protein
MELEPTAIIEVALINLAFAQAELSAAGLGSSNVQRALDHIKIAIADLVGLAPKFGDLDSTECVVQP